MSIRQETNDARTESIRIGPDDPRYLAVVNKRFNKRFVGSPDYVRLVSSTDQIVSAVEEAVREKRCLVVTSGGHCLEGFVSDPDVRVIVDTSPMKRVYYDAEQRAVAVEAGATVGETFRALFETWGVVIPLGEYPGIGMGGHVVGGAFGFLCRELGLAADYLSAVEVVTVDKDGRPTVKDALLRKRFTDRQIAVAYDYLTRTDHDVIGGMLGSPLMAGGSIPWPPMRPPRRNAIRSSTSRARRVGWIRGKRRRIWPGCERSIGICLRTAGACPCLARRMTGH
jgi:FAD/FMN-containing dehydrogenase